MPILTQCTSCGRKLRVQDHLFGKTVKCPGCQAKFPAQPIEESAPRLTPVGQPPAPPTAEEMRQTPVVQTLELAEAEPVTPAPQPRSDERITVAAPALPTPETPPTPPTLPPFPTPPLKVFALLAVILLVATVMGLGFGGCLAIGVQRAIEARQ